LILWYFFLIKHFITLFVFSFCLLYKFPVLFQHYQLDVEIWDGGRKLTVHEHKEETRLALTLVPKGAPNKKQGPSQSCLVNLTSGSGHVIRGTQCFLLVKLQ